MKIRLSFPTHRAAENAFLSFRELVGGLNIRAVEDIEWGPGPDDDYRLLVTLDVPEEFDRAPILAMFAGLRVYWNDGASVDNLVAEAQGAKG